jgi:DHA1 family multidrug resistance protein-like MFS transporter
MIGVVFTCVLVACLIGMVIYCSYLHFYLIPDIMKRGLRQQEHRLVPAIFASFGPVIGLFLFGWTARESIHVSYPVSAPLTSPH